MYYLISLISRVVVNHSKFIKYINARFNGNIKTLDLQVTLHQIKLTNIIISLWEKVGVKLQRYDM